MHILLSFQCRSLRILVDGPEKVPVQVDGEAWMQDPGVISVTHKNKARMIVRDKVSPQNGPIPNRMVPSPTK